MDKKKKIAVIIKDRQGEAFRMCVGLSVLDDEVEIFLTEPVREEGETLMQLEGAREIGLKIYSLVAGTDFVPISIGDMARRLPQYDNIMRY